MEMISLTNEMTLAKAVQALKRGGVLVYPTDTLYGLGGDALSNSAVDTIYEIKGRDEHKPIHSLVSSLEMAERYGVLDERVTALITQLPRGKVTCIVQKKQKYKTGIMRGLDTFGFRIPDNLFCVALCEAFDGPITATSANKSGLRPERTIGPLLAQLGARIQLVDVVVNAGELPECEPSTVVDLSGSEVTVVREGLVSETEVRAVLRML